MYQTFLSLLQLSLHLATVLSQLLSHLPTFLQALANLVWLLQQWFAWRQGNFSGNRHQGGRGPGVNTNIP
jgi:hypothetical protein